MTVTQREYLRRTYESVHGDDPAAWLSQHPGVVLDAVRWKAHPACLRCHWFDEGFYMRREGGLLRALDLARRHEVSDGADDSRAIRRLRTRLNPLWNTMIRDPPFWLSGRTAPTRPYERRRRHHDRGVGAPRA